MSSGDEGTDQPPKRAKIMKSSTRACDMCRRKKIRCDGPQTVHNRCTNCATFDTECTYNQTVKKRGPQKGYIQNLERRVAELEEQLKIARCSRCGSTDIAFRITNSPSSAQAQHSVRALSTSSDTSGTLLSSAPEPLTAQARSAMVVGSESPLDDCNVDSSDDEYIQNNLAEDMKKLSLNPSHQRYFGKSSGIYMIRTAWQLAQGYSEDDSSSIQNPDMNPNPLRRRPHVWSVHPWEIPTYKEEYPTFSFPEPDLLISLTNIYFTEVNSMVPLLHRPTFEADIKDGLHLRDERFASTLLVACSIASRYTDDRRVLMDDGGRNNAPLQSAGWKWFNQVQVVRRSLLATPTLHDLQLYALYAKFLLGSSAPHACWLLVGIALRMAQDVGAHRRKYYGSESSLEGELWKRAVWALVDLERGLSAVLGRPCGLPDEELDIDYPIECDDEFWLDSNPNKLFQQPAGRPSMAAFFNSHLRLGQIVNTALHTIYSTAKYKVLHGYVGHEWEQRTVAELDSALNKWVDTVPEHLKWDPHREDLLHFKQSAILQASYYHVQMLIHRPFISRESSPLALTCMAICTNAARSVCNIVDVLYQRYRLSPEILMLVFNASLLLVLNIWSGTRMGISRDLDKGMEDVQKCMKVLKQHEGRWYYAGVLWDIIHGLVTVGHLPLPQETSRESRKRARSFDHPMSLHPSEPNVRRSGNGELGRHTPPSLLSFSTRWQGTARSAVGGDRPEQEPVSQAGPRVDTFPATAYTSAVPTELWMDEEYRQDQPGSLASGLLGPANCPANTGHGQGDALNPLLDQTTYNQFLSDLTLDRASNVGRGENIADYRPESIFDAHESTFSGAALPADFGIMDMWSNLPMSFELGDWESYSNEISDLTQGPITNE